MGDSVSASDWVKGITLSIAASLIGGASKLSIRKSWLMVQNLSDAEGLAITEELKPRESERLAGTNNATPNSLGGYPSQESSSDSTLPAEVELVGGSEALATKNGQRNVYVAPTYQDSGVRPADDEIVRGFDHPSSPSLVSVFPCMTSTRSPNPRRIKRRAFLLRLSGMIGMVFLNPLCCVLAMNYASPSILAPFSGLTLVWIICFSETLIGEKPMPIQIIACACIILGEVIVAIFGDHTNDGGVTLPDLQKSYQQPGFILYFIGITAWMFALTYIIVRNEKPTFVRFAWGVSGGSITGLQNFLKDSLTIIKVVGASNGKVSYPWYFYIMVVLGMGTAFLGLVLLTACMKQYDATYSAAMFVGSFVISASIMSAIHYHTFAGLEHIWNYILYPFGLLVLMVGVLILVKETKDGTRHKESISDGTARAGEGLKRTPSSEMEQPLVDNSSLGDHRGVGLS